MVAKMNVAIWLVYAEVLVKSSSSADEQRAATTSTIESDVPVLGNRIDSYRFAKWIESECSYAEDQL